MPSDEFSNLADDLVQIARLGLAERSAEVGMHLRRMLRRRGSEYPDLSQKLLQLLRDTPSPLSPLRQASSPVPVDADSKLQLLRVEAKPLLDVEPAFVADVGAQLRELVDERRLRDDLTKLGLFPTRTVVFTGPPGVGKTYAARWLALELGLPLLTLDLAAVMSSYLGKTGSNVRQVLQYAKGFECVLLLDELDSIAKKRDDDADVGELKRLVTVLLQAIDDWPPGGLIVGATNHPDLLDPAVWRRFEVRVDFPIPTGEALEAIISRHLAGCGPLAEAWAKVLAIALEGASPCDIERITKRAKRVSAIYGKEIDEGLKEAVRHSLQSKPQRVRQQAALMLVESNILSQRAAQDLTGVSRDTIRKRSSQKD